MVASEPKSVYFCVRNIYIFFIPTRKPETHEKAILIASEPKLLVFWGVKSDQKSETSEKNPEIIASEPKCSYFRVGFFFYHRPENQKIKKKLKIYTDCERAEIFGIFGSETRFSSIFC